MADQRLKELRGKSRREFLRWSGAVAACLGLERSRFLNVLGDTAGSAAADTAACRSTNLHIHVIDGGGGLSNWTQVFPFPKVIGATNPAYSHYALGKGVAGVGFDKPYTHAPDSPWQTNSKWKISAFVAGASQTHTPGPDGGPGPASAITIGANRMLASAAAIQQANPTLLPVLAVNANTGFAEGPYGTAPGAPPIATVGAARQLVDLFNSAASRALLQPSANAALSEAYYKAFLGLNAAAGSSTTAKQYAAGKVSFNLLSRNLAAQLTPTAAEQALFGLPTTLPNDKFSAALQDMSNAMITAVKAFSLGITSMLVVPGFMNDPHPMFVQGDARATAVAGAIGKMLNGLHDFAKSKADPGCSAKTLADSLVFSVSGDTYKEPFIRNDGGQGAWNDGTPNGSNVLYVMGGGHIKTGWFGDIDPKAGAVGWDPGTGAAGGSYDNRAAELGASASAALLFAIAKGDMRRVRDFYSGKPIDGVVNLNVTG